MFHMGGWGAALGFWHTGGTVVSMAKVDPRAHPREPSSGERVTIVTSPECRTVILARCWHCRTFDTRRPEPRCAVLGGRHGGDAGSPGPIQGSLQRFPLFGTWSVFYWRDG
jgi:hypothetical protein